MTAMLKERAKQALQGNYGVAIGVMVVYAIVSGVASQFYGVGTVLVSYPLLVGVNVYFINLLRRTNPQFEDLIVPFKDRYVENMFTIFLMNLYIGLWALLLIIPGIIKTYSYAMTPYIMADKRYNLSYNEAITESRNLMDGRKMDLFILQLSFIGWMLLGILTFGLLYIWLIPYMQAATTAFYLDITGGTAPSSNGNHLDDVEPMSAPQEEPKQNDEWDF